VKPICENLLKQAGGLLPLSQLGSYFDIQYPGFARLRAIGPKSNGQGNSLILLSIFQSVMPLS